MARRCGCSEACNCVVQAGDGTTVTGDGSQSSPYVVSADAGKTTVADSPSVDHTLTGSGTAADPYVLSSEVIYSADANNCATRGTDGGILVPCAQTFVQGTPNDIVVTGSGTVTDPYVVSSDPASDCCPVVLADPAGTTTVTPGTNAAGQPTYTVAAVGGGAALLEGCGINITPNPDGSQTIATTAPDFGTQYPGCTPGDPIACGPDGMLYPRPAPAGGVVAAMAIPGVTMPGGTTGPTTASGPQTCLSATNDECVPMEFIMEFLRGAEDLNASQGNTVINARIGRDFAINAPANPITATDPVALSSQFQVATQVAPTGGATNNVAINVGSGQRIWRTDRVTLQPGDTLNVCVRTFIVLDNGRGGGAVLTGGLRVTATRAA